jgi:hypothetical protein
MDSDDSVPVVLFVESAVKELRVVFYEFYIGDKDNAFSTRVTL